MSEHVYSQAELVRIILPLLKKYHAARAILFGSYARNEATTLSDIDLVVVGGDAFDPTDVLCIADELHHATGKAVDVYELREINAGTEFYNTIMGEGVRIA
jgi:predicted nucleotidyltransferase